MAIFEILDGKGVGENGFFFEVADKAVAGARGEEVAEEETVEEAVEEEDTKDEGVQTGETKMTTTQPTGEQEEMTAFVDAKAQEGNVVVKDGTEVQS